MEKIKTILVDDERDSREVLAKLLANFFPEIEIIHEASSVEEAYTKIKAATPQLVFLDIQMPKASGFDLLKKFEEVPFEVVFVTSFDKYAINAIKFSALDYILKPVEVNELKDAVEKVKKSLATKTKNGAQIVNLLHNLESDINEQQVPIHNGESVKLLSSSKIIYIEADGRYSNITYDNNERYVTAKNLKEFEEYFGEESFFLRIHKSCMINVKHIKEYSKGEPCFVKMMNGTSFEISRRKKQEVLEKLKK